MGNAPTSPPNRSRSVRISPPRGPRRVPRKRPELNEVREQVAAAGKKLRDMGEPALADAVDYTLTPAYWASIRYGLYEKDRGPANLPIGTRKSIRDHLHAAAEAAGTTLTDVANTALRDFISGKFTPQKPSRGASAPGDPAVNINLRPDVALRAQAEERCKELTGELGWKVAPAQVIKQYLLHRFPLPDTN